MTNLQTMTAAYTGRVGQILASQLHEHGMPTMDLPKLRAPSGFCVQSPIFGYSEAPARMVVLRYEHHERLIAEADANRQVH